MEKLESEICDLYLEKPRTPALVRPTSVPLLLASFGILVICVAVIPSFLDCYNERAFKFDTHRDYLLKSGHCDTYLQEVLTAIGETERVEILNNIQVESAKFRGIQTNCTQAYLYIQQLKFLGTVGDWYSGSTIYSILTGGNWKIQITIAVTVPMVILTIVKFWLNYSVKNNAVNRAYEAIKSPGSSYAMIIDQ